MSAGPPFLNEKPLAPYAADWRRSRGRLFPEPPSPTRGEFQRDRDRLIHSTAFRRLAHKTQVFIPIDGDHFRTRLTHTIEVAQISRALARGLALDEDLAEATALAHDLGHTCFGHAGEEVLNACMAPFGGFDHNAHALRIVTKLERRYAGWDGLNLCYETLEGLVKHNGPLCGPHAARYASGELPFEIREFNEVFPLNLEEFASAEAQCAALADDIAYNAHDIDDGLRAGLFSLDDLRDVAFLRGLLDEIAALHPGLERVRVIHELVRRVITRFVEDAFAETARAPRRLGPGRASRTSAAPNPPWPPFPRRWRRRRRTSRNSSSPACTATASCCRCGRAPRPSCAGCSRNFSPIRRPCPRNGPRNAPCPRAAATRQGGRAWSRTISPA